MAHFRIPYGEEDQHAVQLRTGLSKLPHGFVASVCGVCEGRGQYRQMYTRGCGMGYYHAMGDCEYCGGTGLLQGRGAAPDSVREQVLNAAHN